MVTGNRCQPRVHEVSVVQGIACIVFIPIAIDTKNGPSLEDQALQNVFADAILQPY